MRCAAVFLLTALSAVVQATEKLPLTDFLQGLSEQLHSMEPLAGGQPAPGVISNVHVELHVIAEKDPQGKISYYVLEGLANRNEVITQRLSFDIELQGDLAARRQSTANRRYSTRPRDYRYGVDRYRPVRPYPYPPDSHMPDINPVILYDPKP